MSRDIKFRAWDKAREQMATYELGYVIGISLDGSLDVTIEEVRGDEDVSRTWCKDSEDIILMQYTGLKDKNGVEIYEGDMLADSIVSRIVMWSGDNACFVMCRELREDGKHGHWLTFDRAQAEVREVIGNIYENGELLKENDD